MTAAAPLAPTRRAAIYTRVSQDASGVARSPREQEAESRRDCERNGWDVVEVYCDNDRSASRYARKGRESWGAVLADIAERRFDVLVVWEASRLTRDIEAYAALATACRGANVHLSYNGRVFDLDNAGDAFSVGLDILVAERYSAETSARIRRTVRASAEAGRPHGKRTYGHRRIYDRDTGQITGQEPDPVEAPIVREIYTRVARGDSMRGIARDLNARGILARQGTPWRATKIKQTVELKTHLGHRTHQGRVVCENAWPALVDEVTFYRVQAILGTPGRAQGHRPARYLMSGLVACGVCGAACYFHHVGRHVFPVYRCPRGHVSRAAHVLDEGVRLHVAGALVRPGALDVFNRDETNAGDVTGERDALLARLDEADEALAAGELTARAHGKLEASLRPRLDELDAVVARGRAAAPAPVADIAAELTVEAALARLAAADLGAQRLVVRTVLAECVLRKAPPSRHRSDLGLTYRWCGVGDPVDI